MRHHYDSIIIYLSFFCWSFISCTEKVPSLSSDLMGGVSSPTLIFTEQMQLDSGLTIDSSFDVNLDFGLESDFDANFAQDLGTLLPDVSMETQSALDHLVAHLPIPYCVAYLDGSCIIEQTPTEVDRCEQWGRLIRNPPNPVNLGDIQCSLEDIPNSTLQATQEYINLFRSWAQLPPISFRQTEALQQCALRVRVSNIDRNWNENTQCFSSELNQVNFENTYISTKSWTSFERVEQMLGLTLNRDDDHFRMRHILYSSKLNQLTAGRYHDVDCLKPVFNQSEVERTPFSIYPGTGVLPLELVSPGNNYRKTVPWSIFFNEENVSDLGYQVTQIAPTFQILNTNPLELSLNSKYVAFELDQSIEEGDVYKIDLSWNKNGEVYTAQVYLSFASCGYITPSSACHPADLNACSMPGFGCTNRLNRWTCSRTGPIGIYEEGCMNASFSCQPNLLCVGTEVFQEGLCVPYCHLSSEQENACEQTCGDLEISSGTLNQLDFGYCFPRDN